MLVQVLPASRFGELASKWDCLARGVPFRGWLWHDQWLRSQSSGSQAFVATVVDPTGEIVGAAPLVRTVANAYGASLRLWGDAASGSEYRSILTTCEHEAEVSDALAAWLVACVDTPEFGWTSLSLHGLSASDRVANQLAGRLGDEGSVVRREAAAPRRRVDLPATWDAYESSLASDFQDAWARSVSSRVAAGEARLRIAENLADFDEGIAAMESLRALSAAELAGETAAPEAGESSLVDACRRLFADDRATLAWLEWEGRPVAVELRPCSPEVEYCSRRAFDPFVGNAESEAELDAGSLLRTLLMRRAIEQGRKAVDLLACDLAEASRWNAVDRPAVNLRITAPRLSARVRQGVWLAGETMKNLFRTGANLAGM